MFMRYMFQPHRAIFRQHIFKESPALCILSIVLLKYIERIYILMTFLNILTNILVN
jgi:hypothetical protein